MNSFQSHGNCLADLCGALHCDAVMDSTPQKSKCNPAAAARNRHLCEVHDKNHFFLIFPQIFYDLMCITCPLQSLADNCFPVNRGPSASRLHGMG